MQGKVRLDDQALTKAGTMVADDAPLECNFEEPKYVSRAGFKLEKALEHFTINVQGLTCLDAGLSTGGFTDCLLQHGARKVYGIEVGHGQTHEKIRKDSRVVILEHTNLRDVRDVGEKVDLVTLDVSFISVLKLMDAVCAVLKDAGQLVILIKPQFEAQKYEVGKGGIIRDKAIHEDVIKRVTEGVVSHGFECIGVIESPITGTEGNKEFLAYFNRVKK
jgi:23S rRNA (cytidine1920-2'-O)/16S rRNA (cytidine1409-2'-O)-methyltransferase